MRLSRHFLLTFVLSFLIACTPDQPSPPSADDGQKLNFVDPTKEAGISFSHVPTRTETKWLPEIMGSGVAVTDLNRDGGPDIILVNSGALGADSRPPGAENKLYINNGDGTFADKTDEWKLTSHGYGQGVAVGDIDNDGWTDVFLTTFEGDNRLLKNTGTGFVDITTSAGLVSDGKWATSAGFFDYDSDGDLDLYVARYVDFTTSNPHKVYRNRMLIYSTPLYYTAVPDQLWQNDGTGKFISVGEAVGISKVAGNGLALAIGDIDADGDQDIYVANDSDANMLWINDAGKFRDAAPTAGVAYSEMGQEEGSMGADMSDTDANGRLDIAVTNFQEEPVSLYRQTEPLLFRELSDAVGIGETSRQRLSFGLDFFDANNDGFEDLLIANGHIEDNIETNTGLGIFAQQNTLFLNLANGKFADVSDAAGSALKDVQVSRGLATGDLNGDGALDFLIMNNGGTAQLAFNRTDPRGNFVILWLEGKTSNRNAIGARVTARIGDKLLQREVMGAQSYLSVSDFRLHFGLGSAEKIDELTISWPGSQPQIITDVVAGKFYHIRQGENPAAFVPGSTTIAP